MSQLEFIIGGESVLVDDISNESMLSNQIMPPQDMYYVNLPSNKMTVKEIKQHIVKDLPELITTKIDESIDMLSDYDLKYEVEQFNLNPYLERPSNDFLLEICLNPTEESLLCYFGSVINQSPQKSRYICNVMYLYSKTMNEWRNKYGEYVVQPTDSLVFNIKKCKYQIYSLVKLLLNELK
jgi:hypothetical protein